jgi:hypothetical protein
MEKIPCSGLAVSLCSCLSFLLLLKGSPLSLFLCFAFHLLPLLWRGQKVSECRVGLLVVDRPDWGSNDLRYCRRFKLGLQSKLKLKVV